MRLATEPPKTASSCADYYLSVTPTAVGAPPSVLFWAQETNADARTWGVDGSTLTQPSANLNDCVLHGVRLAAAGDGRTEGPRDL